MSDRTHAINTIGLMLSGADNEHFKFFRVYEESGSVQIWADVRGEEAMQYLTPLEAMRFAKAFERCAIQALKNKA